MKILATYIVCVGILLSPIVSPLCSFAKGPNLNANTDPKILRQYVAKTDEIIKKNGPTANYYSGKAQLLEWLHEYSDASETLSKAIKLEPFATDYYVRRARNFRKLKKLKSSEKDYSKAISMGAKTCETYTGRALVRLASKNFRGAMSDAKKAISCDPNEKWAWYAKGSSEGHLGMFKSSIKSLTLAIGMSPNEPVFLQRRSQVYEKIGKLGQSEKDKQLVEKLKAK